MTRAGLVRTVHVLLAFALFLGSVCGADDRAFPGAEGFGGDVKGGAGGKVIWVTNLNSHGPGSLREAIDTPGPRLIKFKVGGTIDLEKNPLGIGSPFRKTYQKLTDAGKSPEEIDNPYSFVTIDGASAPPPGITLSGNLSIGGYGAKHVIVRNIRIRDNGFVGRSGADCICIIGSHVLIDHCSLQWARDEVVNPWYETAHDITVQWCIIGPGWGPHGYGFVNGSGTDHITLHHNLFPHNRGRNPLICGNSRDNWIGKFANDTPVLDCRNNVVYNWVYEAATITAGAHVNLVGNVFIPGLDTPDSSFPLIRAACRYHTKPTVLYLRGNRSPRRPRDDMDEWADAGSIAKTETKGYQPVFGPSEWGARRDTPFPAPPVITHSAEDAKALVLSQVGAWPRDAIDAAIIRNVLDGTGYCVVNNALPSDYTNTKPTARASAKRAGDKDALTVSFEGHGEDKDGKIVFCTWDFGDGHRAVGENVSHTYAEQGDSVATLFVTDGHGAGGTASLRVRISKDDLKTEPIAAPALVDTAAKEQQRKWKPPTVELGAPLPQAPAEADWQRAPRLMPFIDQASWKKVPEGKIDARAQCDGEQLYVRFICDGFPSKAVKPIHALSSPERHPREVRGHNGIILFLSPRHGEGAWYRFDVCPAGRRYDARGGDRGWNAKPDWKIKSTGADGTWHVTFAIPLKAIGADAKPGSALGLKLIIGTQKDDLCIWPPVGSIPGDRYCVPETWDPIYYAKLRLP